MDGENDEPWMHYFNVEDFMTTFNARDSTK